MSEFWIAVAAGGLAGLFALLGGMQGRRNEHRAWRRDARRSAYLEFLASADAAADLRAVFDAETADVSVTDLHHALSRTQQAARDVMIVGPNHVLTAAQDVYDRVVRIVMEDEPFGPDSDADAGKVHEWRIEQVSAHRDAVTRFAGAARVALRTRRS